MSGVGSLADSLCNYVLPGPVRDIPFVLFPHTLLLILFASSLIRERWRQPRLPCKILRKISSTEFGDLPNWNRLTVSFWVELGKKNRPNTLGNLLPPIISYSYGMGPIKTILSRKRKGAGKEKLCLSSVSASAYFAPFNYDYAGFSILISHRIMHPEISYLIRA